jgi:hypothetical protein
MLKKTRLLVLLAVGALALRGDSCFIQNKDIEVPLKGYADMAFTSQGLTDLDVFIIDFFLEIQDIEEDADVEVDSLISASVENGYWRLVENRGPANTTITGSLTVTRVLSNETAQLIAPQSVNIDNVGTEFVVIPLEKEGLDLLTEGFNDYIAYRNGETGPPDLIYRFDWSSSSGSITTDFDWEARLKYTITGAFSVDVPDLWGD